MQPLNPFLSALSKSAFLSICSPSRHYVLLVPTTDVLLTSRDPESGASIRDSISSEEFLGSHVLRVAGNGGGTAAGAGGKDGATNLREVKGKAKLYNTVNGRSVVIKDNIVYSNKGFKTLAQATILHDSIWHPDTLDLKAFLVYYISRPLVGSWEEYRIPPAISPRHSAVVDGLYGSNATAVDPSQAGQSVVPTKKEISSFHELLNSFPVIARQMQPGLEKLFHEFTVVFGGQLPPPPSAPDTPDSLPEGPITASVRKTRTHSVSVGDAEDLAMRAAQEAAVNRAVELFQSVESQQLSMLGATTQLTGQAVERLLEGYIAENVHHLVFPRLSVLKRRDDLELEAKIRQMEFIDVNQLGVALQGWTEAKRELTKRLDVAVSEFRNMNSAIGPQQSLKVLLATMKAIGQVTDSPEPKYDQTNGDMSDSLAAARERRGSEKIAMTLNADTLVSLLLFVIIRARVKHLEARMLYIRHYIFTEDVDSGEMGYALSTFEAVLVYLVTDSGSLRRASRRNKALWDAVAQGDLVQLKGILESPTIPDGDSQGGDDIILESSLSTSIRRRSSSGWSAADSVSSRRSSSAWTSTDRFSLGSDLNHVFPFPTNSSGIIEDSPLPPLPRVKRVAMDTRSMSSGSEISYRSRATSTVTLGSSIEGDTSVERLSKTQNSLGESILMMAVQNQREEVLKYLLSLQTLLSPQMVLDDMDNNGSTLLSAAVQHGGEAVLHVLVEYLFQARLDEDDVQRHGQLRSYLARQDAQGRSAAHYMFHAPALLDKLGQLLPWRQKDKNGQTPLFALCRSYDHISYRQMVDKALTLAEAAQADGLPLHVDDHVDAKGNTLLHIVNDGAMVARILHTCDVDVNATNDKKFTPLMVASKYGRFELVRILFADARVDVSAKELRGLTAVELAKDDEVRNRIDDLALFTMPPASDSRTTGVVRSYFIEDATVRFVIKSGAPADQRSYAVTTCRRSLADFELLIKLLTMENPASWIPSLANLRSPTQIPSKPSRAVLRDLQIKMDWLLRILLLHPTFATHEMLWEFFLVPDLQTEQMEQRSKLKAELRAERIREETEPLLDVRDVEQFMDHARDTVRGVHFSTRSVARRVCVLGNTANDLHEAGDLLSKQLTAVHFLPQPYIAAFQVYADSLREQTTSPRDIFHASWLAILGTVEAMLRALAHPQQLISQMATCHREADRQSGSLSRSSRWPLGLLDDARQRAQDEREERVRRNLAEADMLAKELRYSQQVVAGELADWQVMHERLARRAIRDLARGMITTERLRLQGVERALRKIKEASTLEGR